MFKVISIGILLLLVLQSCVAAPWLENGNEKQNQSPTTTLRPNPTSVKPLPATSTQNIMTATDIFATTGKFGNAIQPTATSTTIKGTTIKATTAKGDSNVGSSSATAKPMTNKPNSQGFWPNPAITPKPTTQNPIVTTKLIQTTSTGRNIPNGITTASTVSMTTSQPSTINSSSSRPSTQPLPATSTQKIPTTTAKTAAVTLPATTNKPTSNVAAPTKPSVVQTSPIPTTKPHF